MAKFTQYLNAELAEQVDLWPVDTPQQEEFDGVTRQDVQLTWEVDVETGKAVPVEVRIGRTVLTP